MSDTNDKRSELEKFYDKAYQHGFGHCMKMVEIMATKYSVDKMLAEMRSFINEKFPEHMKQQTTEPCQQ